MPPAPTAPPTALATSASATQEPSLGATGGAIVVSPDDAAFWASVPAWLQEKIVRRSALKNKTGGAAHLPPSDAAHFAALPPHIKERLRAQALVARARPAGRPVVCVCVRA